MTLEEAFNHLFIPHEHNDYKPHFFREVSVGIVVAVSLFLLGFSFGSSYLIHKTVLGAEISADVLVDLTNQSRVAQNEAPLLRNPILDHAAQMKADDMVEKGYFAHTSPDGVTPWHWFEKAGYTFLYAGENLAINFTDAQAVRDAWMASPKHRENILDVKFKEIGMATLMGVYQGDPSIYVVQMFGTPARAEASAATTTLPTTVHVPSERPILLAQGKVEGATATNTPPVSEGHYESIIATPNLAIVKNTNAVTPLSFLAPFPRYSTSLERFLFSGSYLVDIIYRLLIIFVTIALLAMIFIEVRKQHWKHISYGLGVLLVLSLSLFINQTFF